MPSEERDLWLTEVEEDFDFIQGRDGRDMRDELNVLLRSFTTFETTEERRIVSLHGLALQGSVELNQLRDLTILSERYELSTDMN
jgi:hypothetical protein